MIYVTSDIHGRFECLKRLLDAVNFSESDWLWIIGDVIDRNGDGGIEMLKWLLWQPNVQLILGNHENFLLANRWLFEEISDESIDNFDASNLARLSLWRSNGGDVTVKALSDEPADMRQDILDYLDDCPLFETVSVGDRKYLLVHGGLGNYDKAKRPEDYTPDELLWARPSLSTEYSPSEYTVIVGHTPTVAYSERYKNRMIKTNSFWNIDTGAAMKDGKPMLLCLDTLKEYYLTESDEVITASP